MGLLWCQSLAAPRAALDQPAAARARDQTGALHVAVGGGDLLEEAAARQLAVVGRRHEDVRGALVVAHAPRQAGGRAPRRVPSDVAERPVDVVLHRARHQRLLRRAVELREEQRREASAAAAVGHHVPQRGALLLRVVEQVVRQLVGVGVGLEHDARFGEVVEEGKHLERGAEGRRAVAEGPKALQRAAEGV